MTLELIDKLDTSEIVRDQIAAILLSETKLQQALATTAAKDPRLWTWRVFLERQNPWEAFRKASTDGTDPLDVSPIVHVTLDNTNFDPSMSNIVEQQKCKATFHIDCYGYGVSADVSGGGHVPGDEAASIEAQRAARLIRNVLMAADNIRLQLPGTVHGRWMDGMQIFHPPVDTSTVEQVVGARLTFETTFSEFSPQVQGQIIESLYVTIKRAGTGEVYFVAKFDH